MNLNQSIRSNTVIERPNRSFTSLNKSLGSNKCDSCGRSEADDSPQLLKDCFRKAENFWNVWIESGLWLLAVAVTGLACVFALSYIAIHSFHFMRTNLVFKDSNGKRLSFESNLLQFLSVIVILFILVTV